MNSSDPNLPPEESSSAARNEEDLLENESQLARGALQRLREDIMQSLRRSADVRAWAAQYPWPTLGAAAAAGIAGGWRWGVPLAINRRWRKRWMTAAESADFPHSDIPHESSAGHPAARLVSGLGTFAGAFASAAIGAATQAIGEAVKELIHDTLHPETENEEEPPAEDVGQ